MGLLQEKVLLVNFPENVKKEFDRELKKLEFPLAWDVASSEGRLDKEELATDYDFIFIYEGSSSEKRSRTLSQIRLTFPLSELFVVTYQKDYDLAVEALRMGARDIIGLPMDSQELNLMIQTARTFHKARKHSKQYFKLIGILNNFGDIRKFTAPRQIFETVQKYMASQFPVTKVRAFHYYLAKQTVRFGFGTPYKIALSPEECLALSCAEKKYKVKGNQLYLVFFDERDVISFLSFEFKGEWEILKWDHFFEMLSSAIRNCYGYVKKYQSEVRMSSLAHTDDVTGLYNQRKLLRDLDQEIRSALQENGHFSLIFLDIDHFKNVNDGYGHIIGSKLLVQVAGVIRKVIRETDYIYRYGGDEFVIILLGVKAEDARRIGERLLQRMKHQDFVAGSDQKFKLSLSIGIAEYPRDARNREDILSMADKMMYKAKKSGRGKVCLIGSVR